MEENRYIYIDIVIEKSNLGGRVIFELSRDVETNILDLFCQLCNGIKCEKTGKNLSYTGSQFFYIKKGQIIKAKNKLDYIPILNKKLDHLKYQKISNINISTALLVIPKDIKEDIFTFYIILGNIIEENNKYIVLGKCIFGMDIIKKVELVPVDTKYYPKILTYVSNIGQLNYSDIKLLKNNTKEGYINTNNKFDKYKSFLLSEKYIPDKIQSSKLINKLFDINLNIRKVILLNKNELKREREDILDKFGAIVRDDRIISLKFENNKINHRFKDFKYLNKKYSDICGNNNNYNNITIDQTLNSKPIILDIKKINGFSNIQDKFNFNEQIYNEQMRLIMSKDNDIELLRINHKPNDSTKKRLIETYTKSRRIIPKSQKEIIGTNINHINSKNLEYNRIIEKFFGKYCTEIKRNLERGTA
ncbi:hypothetical protein cand_003780 [Cryptosporidium andersoni]|uniref:PPIase cyclophilin-type domain-containing protein n=1 Tax=Cryptosporidium andersoni TaxID=117008 RepID=A0A1J4MMF0_9CRYT|nr:hypothetical protein cand_003780 [Cryptosporidium andersoni]